ncbi:hypothetical protein KC19_10G110200 [Ceratodon purpureus]|uniref:Peptidase A2 domain-containing protein n=1 Tax=Ceratodon purpureus TaxID=3225 RepID=A0A8T0GKG3_CERPU|nr:hypothetical protein KC19_10G110200 [Ceratodon purpureus]
MRLPLLDCRHHHPGTLPVAYCGGVSACFRRKECMPLTSPRVIRLRSERGYGVLQTVSCVHQCGNVQSKSCHGNELRSYGDEDEEERNSYIERICEAIGADEIGSDMEITVSGRQTLLAMEGNWVLKWGTGDGRFWERFDGVEMTIEWGCDGGTLEPWAVDAAGRCSVLELDDREVSLLAAWVRTGFWVTKEGRRRLRIRLVQDGDVLGVDWATSSMEHTFSVQLKDGKVVAYVVVDATTMFPLRAGIRAFGGWSKWQYFDWKPLVAGQRHIFPFSSVHTQASENKEVYLVEDCSIKSCNDGVNIISESMPSFSFSLPALPVVSRPQANHPHVEIDSVCLPSVPMLRAESGHYLVQPLVDGKIIGYFIVDTGASSLIIAPQKARELGLFTFGEIYITGVNGVVKSQYCRANTFQLGQLRITNPVFMEIPLSGLVRGDPLVVGMCGFDIFAECIVEMAYDEGMMSLFDPSPYRLLYSETLQWHALHLMESVPYVSATFNGHTAQFLLDTGAGGVDVIFHGRAVEEFDLLDSLQSESYAELMGINASGKGLQVTLGTLDQLTVAGRSFKQVKAMLAREDAGNLDTSAYVSGLLCGDLLMKCRIVFDYARRRFAVKGTLR